jgi:hypothetical protein
MAIYWYNKASDLRGAAGLVWVGMEDERASATATTLGLGKAFSFVGSLTDRPGRPPDASQELEPDVALVQ